MRYTRHIAAAVVVVVTVSSLSNALIPCNGPEQARDANGAAQYSDTHQRDVESLRRSGTTLQDAVNSDELTPADLRPEADDAADDIVRDLLRRS